MDKEKERLEMEGRRWRVVVGWYEMEA